MKLNFSIFILVLLMPISGFGQQFDRALMEESDKRNERSMDFTLLNRTENAHWAVEFSWGLNNWNPTAATNGESYVRNALESMHTTLSSNEFNYALSDMNNQGILSSFNYYYDNSTYLKPRILRLRYRPDGFDQVDVSLGVGRTPAFFYAIAAETSSGSTIGLNQTEVLAGNYVDQYFYFRELFENWFIERPTVQALWTPLMLELGAGFQATDLVRFQGALGIISGGVNGANDWKSRISDEDIPSSISEFQSVAIAQSLILGSSVTLRAVTIGLDYRTHFFLSATSSYLESGAQAQSLPSFVSFCLGYAW